MHKVSIDVAPSEIVVHDGNPFVKQSDISTRTHVAHRLHIKKIHLCHCPTCLRKIPTYSPRRFAGNVSSSDCAKDLRRALHKSWPQTDCLTDQTTVQARFRRDYAWL